MNLQGKGIEYRLMSVGLKVGTEIEFVGHDSSWERGKPLDKQEANEAFKKCKKEILDVFFAENGFFKYKTTAYVRLSKSGLLQNVNLQKSQFDYERFYVNYEVLPLYLPMKYLEMGLDHRLNNYVRGFGDDWHYRNYEVARINFEDLREAVKICLLPWFEKSCDGENFRQMLMEDKDKKWPGYPNERWRKALERSEEERKAVILENIEKFKLPKRLVKGIFDP